MAIHGPDSIKAAGAIESGLKCNEPPIQFQIYQIRILSLVITICQLSGWSGSLH